MFGAILKATNSSIQKGIAFYRSVYVKKVMKLLAFIFEQPSYCLQEKCKNMVMRFQSPLVYFFSDDRFDTTL